MNARDEFHLFARHLIGGPSVPELARRYAEGRRALGLERDDATTRALEHAPWLLGPLDAAAALLEPRCLLRRRLLLAAAVLEASPRHARQFLPEDIGPIRLAGRLLKAGAVSLTLAMIGVLPLLLLRAARAS